MLILAPSIISFEAVLAGLPAPLLEGLLVVDVLSVKTLPKAAMLKSLPPSCDIVCTHPMFGPESGKHGWRDLPFVYDAVRVADRHRLCRFLSLWEEQVRSAFLCLFFSAFFRVLSRARLLARVGRQPALTSLLPPPCPIPSPFRRAAR